jgi:hypothetical protein
MKTQHYCWVLSSVRTVRRAIAVLAGPRTGQVDRDKHNIDVGSNRPESIGVAGYQHDRKTSIFYR